MKPCVDFQMKSNGKKTEIPGFPQTEQLCEDTEHAIKAMVTQVDFSSLVSSCVIAPSKLGLNSKTWVNKVGAVFR